MEPDQEHNDQPGTFPLGQAWNNNADQLEGQAARCCPPRPGRGIVSEKSPLRGTERRYRKQSADSRAEGRGHCPAHQDLDESPARVEGTNKSEP